MKNKIENLKVGEVLTNVDLKKLTTYKLDGFAKTVVFPSSVIKLKKLIKYLKENKISFKIIGGGSNLIFKGDYNGVLIKLSKLDRLKIRKSEITVGAGYNVMLLSQKMARLGYTGFEFASGIPGTIGGAVYNNAGAYKSDMGYIVKSIKVLDKNNNIYDIRNSRLNFHYRTSLLKQGGNLICLEVKIILKKGNKKEIIELIKNRLDRRRDSQPIDMPTAGSVFRNPNDISAWKLIEDSGLKGFKIGGAKISEKHANFIVNYDSAKGKDVVDLINYTKKQVMDKFGVELYLEQEIVEDI